MAQSRIAEKSRKRRIWKKYLKDCSASGRTWKVLCCFNDVLKMT